MNASLFAQAFRQHVIPALRPKIALCGPLVAGGYLTFSEAIAALTLHAHGATRLDQDTFNQFEDWLCAQLTIEAAKYGDDPFGYREREDMAA